MTDMPTAFQPTLRLHRLSWVFALSASIWQMLIPLTVLLIFGTRDGASPISPLIFPLIVAALVIRAVWRQRTYRYGFGPRGLVIHEGLIFRNVRQIEYSRIENIDTERGLLQRAFGVAEVSVQTSTGGKAEALISVLDLAAVQQIRERVFATAAPVAHIDDAEDDEPLLRLPVAELVRYGLIDNRGMIIVAAVGGLLYEMGLFNMDRQIMMSWQEVPSLAGFAALGIALQGVFLLGAILSALLAIRVLSILLAIVTLFDFTLTRHEPDLRVRYGLLTRIALTLRTPRIQAVQQTQTFLHRWFDRVSLHVNLIGDHGEDEEQQRGTRAKIRLLVPLCRTEDAAALIAAALPAIDLTAEPDWQKLAPSARSRIFRRTLMLWTVLAIAPSLWYLGDLTVLVLLSGGLFAWLHAHLYVKHTAWALLPDVLLYRRGWLTRRLSVAPRGRVQSVSLTTSPFDSRWRMASIFVDTAGGVARDDLRIRYLDASVAETLMKDLYQSAATQASV